MEHVYLLQHYYEESNGHEDTKTLGIFSSYQNAESAIERYRNLPGFEKYPEGFYIDCYQIDKEEWTEGFGDI